MTNFKCSVPLVEFIFRLVLVLFLGAGCSNPSSNQVNADGSTTVSTIGDGKFSFSEIHPDGTVKCTTGVRSFAAKVTYCEHLINHNLYDNCARRARIAHHERVCIVKSSYDMNCPPGSKSSFCRK
jgi:hypothetical protein